MEPAAPPATALPNASLSAAGKKGMESDDEGPFFDLEFSVPEGDFGEEADESKEEDGDYDKEPNETESSEEIRIDGLFFKRRLIPLEPKPATSIRILTLGLRQHKSSAPEPGLLLKQSKCFVKCKVGEARDVALKEKKASNPKVKACKYFSKIKPLCIRASKRYAEKLRLTPIQKEPAKAGDKSQNSALPASIRMACKRLGKRKPDSSVRATVPFPQRDESLLVRQDGIQSAIAHCKRSLSAVSKDVVRSRCCLAQMLFGADDGSTQLRLSVGQHRLGAPDELQPLLGVKKGLFLDS